MDFCFINEWKSYIDDKSCPANIIPIINYTFQNQSKQLVLHSGLKIICDWTYINNINSIVNNEELLNILQSVIDDSYYVLNLDVVFIIINNLMSDSKTTVKLHNIENFIPRLVFCNKIIQKEWWYMVSNYSTYKFHEPILKYVCTNILDGFINELHIQVIYRQCAIEPLQTIKLLSKYNIFTFLENYIDSKQFIFILKIFNCAIKLGIQILLTPFFYKTLYNMNKLYKFLSRMMLYNFDFYKHESVFSIYTDKLIISKNQVTLDELVFLSFIYKHFRHVYIQKIAQYLKSKLKHINSELGLIYFHLVRKIYNQDPTLYNKPFINRVLNHPYSFYFCENLRELSYRNCIINKIKTDKLFIPF